MGVDVLTLVALIFQAGNGVIKKCLTVQQCVRQAARIALRTQNVLGLLPVGEEEWRRDAAPEYSLLHLRELLETILVKLERCKKPARASVKRGFHMKATKEALLEAEADLERVTSDLGLPVLDDIELRLDEMTLQPVESAPRAPTTSAGSAAAAAAGEPDEASTLLSERSSQAGEEITLGKARGAMRQGMRARTRRNGGASVEDVIRGELATSPATLSFSSPMQDTFSKRLPTSSVGDRNNARGLLLDRKRVRFDHLVEGRCIGEGTFGKVLAGTYYNRDVAIKKARAPVSANILQEFRCSAGRHLEKRVSRLNYLLTQCVTCWASRLWLSLLCPTKVSTCVHSWASLPNIAACVVKNGYLIWRAVASSPRLRFNLADGSRLPDALLSKRFSVSRVTRAIIL